MRILYVAPQYDYGRKSRGLSFEHFNFYQSLCAMGLEVAYFDYPTLVDELGRRETNRRLEAIVRSDRPDVLFGVVRRDLIDKRAMRRISEQTDTVTINWFCDDHWQFESHARAWTPCFNHVVTTSQTALAQYRRHGLTNVIKSQWAANQHAYRPTRGACVHDVTFVGQPYGVRAQAVEALRRAGVRVKAWGNGWEAGKLDQAEMVRVFGTSRINLNFADASSETRTRLEALASSHAVATLRDKPALWRLWSGAQRAAQWSKSRAQRSVNAPPRQIKGRVFEVPACGGFLLTQPAEDLDAYLEPGVDCATFESLDDLIDQVRYYLDHEEERRAIAERGYQRTLAEHTYAERFEAIFRRAGVRCFHEPDRLAA
ncbi:MAG: glycosyltransferase [Phycisphaeraceae bacterium]